MVETYEVEFIEEGRTIDIPETKPILEAAEEATIELPYQCRMGICGVCCAMRLNDGEVNQMEGMFLSEDEKKRGYVLTCIGKPKSDLKLQTNTSP